MEKRIRKLALLLVKKENSSGVLPAPKFGKKARDATTVNKALFSAQPTTDHWRWKMGELMEQIMAGGPEEMKMDEFRRVAPFIFQDAFGVPTETLRDCVVALNSLRDREIPAPHLDYGHLNFSTIHLSLSEEREELMRSIASAVVGEFDRLGCKGISARSEVLGRYGLHQSRATFDARIAQVRAKLHEEVDGALVWAPEYPTPAGPLESRSRIVVLTPGNHITGGDLSTLGERLNVMWFGHHDVDKGFLCAPFAGDRWRFGKGDKVTDREGFIAAMTESFGAPRAPIVFED